MDYSSFTERVSECKERLFCSILFYILLIFGSFIVLIILSIAAKVILNIINCMVVGVLHGMDIVCMSKCRIRNDEITDELFELRDKTLSWNKNALTKIQLLKTDFTELRKRSKKIGAIVHFPGV